MTLTVEVGAGAGTPDDPVVVVAVGALDARTAPVLREQLVALCAQGRHHLLVDLDGVALLDPTGLGVLVAALRRVRPHGGSVRLVCSRPDVRRVLAVVGVTGMLPLHPSGLQAGAAAGPSGRRPALGSRSDTGARARAERADTRRPSNLIRSAPA